MLNGQLPKHITPRKFAQNETELAGRIAVRELDRLADMLAGEDAEVALSLAFSLDENRRPRIAGELEAELPMLCQRCLDVVNVKIRTGLNLAVVWSEEQAKALPKDVDPLILEDDTTDLRQLVEDELLLSVPLVAYHENAQCHAGQVFSTDPDYSEDVAEETQDKPNPFSVLAQLKTGD
ncbi:DUF177 domain-containing protein [Kistimonas scapharcae]|uniref:Large ribosomal RNA subunit accumulation protein YceD n=1 Tax=Kistimonas scapharcae TaxID=1036133 RepID=A0ABP8VAH3_9GAMM